MHTLIVIPTSMHVRGDSLVKDIDNFACSVSLLLENGSPTSWRLLLRLVVLLLIALDLWKCYIERFSSLANLIATDCGLVEFVFVADDCRSLRALPTA